MKGCGVGVHVETGNNFAVTLTYKTATARTTVRSLCEAVFQLIMGPDIWHAIPQPSGTSFTEAGQNADSAKVVIQSRETYYV
jgi:hypothetical protein